MKRVLLFLVNQVRLQGSAAAQFQSADVSMARGVVVMPAVPSLDVSPRTVNRCLDSRSRPGGHSMKCRHEAACTETGDYFAVFDRTCQATVGRPRPGCEASTKPHEVKEASPWVRNQRNASTSASPSLRRSGSVQTVWGGGARRSRAVVVSRETRICKPRPRPGMTPSDSRSLPLLCTSGPATR